MRNRYSLIQISLHWATLVMIILTYSAMLSRGMFSEDDESFINLFHFNFGITVWLLMFIRLGLRHYYATPPIEPPLAEWQSIASKGLHWMLYLLFLSLPILGFLTLQFGGKDWVLYGFTVPQWVTPDPSWRKLLKQTHETLANMGYFLIGFHTLAALYHHYIRRDDTLRRMLPGK